MVHTLSLPLYKEGEIDFSARGLLWHTVEDALNVECAVTVLRQVLEGFLVRSPKDGVVQIVKIGVSQLRKDIFKGSSKALLEHISEILGNQYVLKSSHQRYGNRSQTQYARFTRNAFLKPRS